MIISSPYGVHQRRLSRFKGYDRFNGEVNPYVQNISGGMNVETAVASIFKSLTTGAVDFFGGTSSEAKMAQAQAAAAQANAMAQAAAAQATMWKWVIGGGAVLATGIVALKILTSRSAA